MQSFTPKTRFSIFLLIVYTSKWSHMRNINFSRIFKICNFIYVYKKTQSLENEFGRFAPLERIIPIWLVLSKFIKIKIVLFLSCSNTVAGFSVEQKNNKLRIRLAWFWLSNNLYGWKIAEKLWNLKKYHVIFR